MDIGASGGIFTVGFARKAKRVFSFEPSRSAAAMLSETISANALHNVVLERKAVSDAEGTADFYELPQVAGCSWRPEASALSVHGQPDDAIKYPVEVVTIDGYFSGIDRIDVIKIDIEGFEANALRGGLRTISKFKPFIAVDIHRRIGASGDTEQDVRSLLAPMGYRFTRVNHVLLCQL